MKFLLSILLFLAFSATCHAKKFFYPIEIVAGMADLIVVGEISKVDSNSYEFLIKETVKGSETGSIKVKMFEEWTCDSRRFKAEVGQKLFLFLEKGLFKYEIINGSTGELFIKHEKVLRIIDKNEPTVTDLVSALKSFTTAYRFKSDKFGIGEERVFVQLKTDAEIATLSSKTDLSRWFFDRVKLFTIEKE